MKAFGIVALLCTSGLAVTLQAADDIEYKSPDGKFGLRNAYLTTPLYDGNSELIDAHSGAVIVTLDSDQQSRKKLDV